MKIKKIEVDKINSEKNLSSKFINSYHSNLKINCSSLKTNFFLDPFNYYPITEDFYCFPEIFYWGDIKKYNHFYTKKFIDDFNTYKSKFKSISNTLILGSSSFDNYYTNLINFLPRLFFNKDKKIKIAIHRNSSNSFRDFIKLKCEQMNLNLQIIYLDNQFYKCINSEIPEFFNLHTSIDILHSMKIKHTFKKGKKIYIQRKNCDFRNIINEYDLIEKLEKLGFSILNLNDKDINKQIKLFSNAEIIMGPTGSGLANIVFCSKGAKIIEISPKYKYNYENNFKDRYSKIAQYLSLSYLRIEADSLDIDLKNLINKKISISIDKKILKQSNYYKNLILNLKNFEKLF